MMPIADVVNAVHFEQVNRWQIMSAQFFQSDANPTSTGAFLCGIELRVEFGIFALRALYMVNIYGFEPGIMTGFHWVILHCFIQNKQVKMLTGQFSPQAIQQSVR